MTLVCAPATSELLKPLLARGSGPHAPGQHRVAAASWPSGHATASTAVVLCLILIAPGRLRWLAGAAGAAVATLVSYSILMQGWHFPSDVLGGQLVAGTWVLAAVAGLGICQRRWPGPVATKTTVVLTLPPWVGAAGVGLTSVVLGGTLARAHMVDRFLPAHALFLFGATTIALLGLMLSAVVAGLRTS